MFHVMWYFSSTMQMKFVTLLVWWLCDNSFLRYESDFMSQCYDVTNIVLNQDFCCT